MPHYGIPSSSDGPGGGQCGRSFGKGIGSQSSEKNVNILSFEQNMSKPTHEATNLPTSVLISRRWKVMRDIVHPFLYSKPRGIRFRGALRVRESTQVWRGWPLFGVSREGLGILRHGFSRGGCVSEVG